MGVAYKSEVHEHSEIHGEDVGKKEWEYGKALLVAKSPNREVQCSVKC